MAIPSSSSIPEQQTSEYSVSTLIQPQYTNGATAPQRISPNIPARLSNFLPSDPLLSNQTHPDPGNQGWILLNMDRTTEKLISNYIPESDITSKGNLDQKKQRPVASAAENLTPLSTKVGENTSEVLLQIFDPTKTFILT